MASGAASGPTALSRSAIVDAAVRLADADGIGAVSMRRVATALEAGTMSLYNHVEDKRDLHGAMLEQVLTDVRTPPRGGDWKAAIHDSAGSLRAVLVEHPWACDLWESTFPGPARKRVMEGLLRCFREAGFSPRLAHHAFHAVDLYVVGHVRQDVNFDLGDDLEVLAARFLEQTPVEEYPYLIEHFEQHDGDGSDDDFTFMLDLILDGLSSHLQGPR
jgi:AcrR family transcriptional regulator